MLQKCIEGAAYLLWRVPKCLPRTYRPGQDTLRLHWEMWTKLRGAIAGRGCLGDLKQQCDKSRMAEFCILQRRRVEFHTQTNRRTNTCHQEHQRQSCCICMYVCIVCLCICMYVCIVCLCVCMFVLYVCVYVCIVCLCVCMFVFYVCVCTRQPFNHLAHSSIRPPIRVDELLH